MILQLGKLLAAHERRAGIRILLPEGGAAPQGPIEIPAQAQARAASHPPVEIKRIEAPIACLLKMLLHDVRLPAPGAKARHGQIAQLVVIRREELLGAVAPTGVAAQLSLIRRHPVVLQEIGSTPASGQGQGSLRRHRIPFHKRRLGEKQRQPRRQFAAQKAQRPHPALADILHLGHMAPLVQRKQAHPGQGVGRIHLRPGVHVHTARGPRHNAVRIAQKRMQDHRHGAAVGLVGQQAAAEAHSASHPLPLQRIGMGQGIAALRVHETVVLRAYGTPPHPAPFVARNIELCPQRSGEQQEKREDKQRFFRHREQS